MTRSLRGGWVESGARFLGRDKLSSQHACCSCFPGGAVISLPPPHHPREYSLLMDVTVRRQASRTLDSESSRVQARPDASHGAEPLKWKKIGLAMYLERTEQSDGAEQGPRLTDSMLTEQCQLAGLTEGNASAALDGNVLAELSEQRLDDCGGDSERSDQYSGTGSILKCITSRDKTLRSSYPLERRDARPSEPCVRHRSAHDGCPRCTEQQHVTHQHQYSDLAVDELDVNTFERCETCSSSDSNSFKTCAEDSENSLNSSESESEKEAPENWSDDQTGWESCEDDEEPRNFSGTVHDEKKTSDFVLEDYFDLFDRADYHGPTLTQSQRYISCFDGGDIHDCLYGDQLQAEKQPQNARRLTETKPHRNDSSEKPLEGIHGCDSNRRGESGARPEDCKEQHELDDVCEESNVNEAKTCDAAEPLNEPPTSSKQLPNSVVLNAQMIGAPNEGHRVPYQTETQFRHAACSQESQVGDVNEHRSARGESKASDEDSASIEISREVRADIIHSVVSEYDKTEEGDSPGQTEVTEDLDDEHCDGDPDQICRCDYCVPPSTTQVPTKALLPQLESHDTGKICVVIDLDETLVHSSFTPVNHADFITPVDIDGTVYQVYVSKRPHVDEFLRRMGEMFECVLFTASLSKYADPVSDILDKWGAFRSRLFREACVFHKGNYVKDLSHLGRDLNKVIIIDNSPASYTFHPDNAVPVASWFDDMSDSELLDLIPFFERLNNVDDIYDVLKEQRALG